MRPILFPALLPILLLGALGWSGAGVAANPVWLEGKSDTQYQITVYRSASCGCCKGWNDHLLAHNFRVEDVVVDDVEPYKKKFGVPPQGASCHTAVVNGKVIEGHVPAQDIKALLGSVSDVRMLAVPGMPSGGPGMDWDGARQDAFKVYAVSEDGSVGVFNEYSGY